VLRLYGHCLGATRCNAVGALEPGVLGVERNTPKLFVRRDKNGTRGGQRKIARTRLELPYLWPGNMPTPDARSIFAESQRLLEAMRSLHDREHVLMGRLRLATSINEVDTLVAEAAALASVWLDLRAQYSATVERYAASIKTTIRPEGAA
jgi:hypothetical protein